MKDEQEASVTLILPGDMLKRVEEHVSRMGTKGVKVTRSDAIRNALDRGLSEAERRAGVTRGESIATSSKTKREA